MNSFDSMRMKIIQPLFFFALAVIAMNACKLSNKDASAISTDPATIAAGEAAFIQKCSGCHNFKMDGIGPQLGGVTQAESADWLLKFIHDPKATISSGDAHATELFNKYHLVMPSFSSVSDSEVHAIIAFLHTHPKPGAADAKDDSNAIANPIPTAIPVSDVVTNLEWVATIPSSSKDGKLPLTRIVSMSYRPDHAGPFILDQRGKLYKMEAGRPMVYMDMAAVMPKFINEPGLATGFGSFAFHPDFMKNGLFYTSHSESPNSAKADFSFEDSIKPAMQWVVTEWKTNQPSASVFSGTPREILRIDMVTGIHGMQQITFNPLSKSGDEDYGLLYIGIGDGGAVENGYGHLAHNLEKLWGTVIRIDPAGRNSANGKYGIPPANPLASNAAPQIKKEIYAYGFRNPNRITWTKSGQLLVSNIGHSNIESMNLIEKGHDYGWPIREGNFLLNPYGNITKVHPLPSDDSIYHVTYPVVEFDHDEGKAISAGFEYLGQSVPALQGKFVFGDIPSGRLFFVAVSDLKQGHQAPIMEWKVAIKGMVKPMREISGADRVDLHFGRDEQGEIYILTKPDGKIYKITKGN